MRLHQWISTRVGKGIVLALGLACSGALVACADGAGRSQVAGRADAGIEATIFSYDGQDFVRTATTLTTQAGESAINTKLERDNPAYNALIANHSYTGEATVFGHQYAANYAPLTGADGKVTGALFVAVAK